MLELLTVPFVTLFAPPRFRPLRRISAHLAAVDAAHGAVRRMGQVPAEVQRDTGLNAGEVLDLPSQQAALPFFLQPGFGRHSDS